MYNKLDHIFIDHPSGELSLSELQSDVEAARKKGLILAFTPDTVQSLINKILDMQEEIRTLESSD